MTSFQIITTTLFIIGGVSLTWGANKLGRLSHELYPNEYHSGFRPSRRILKRIKEEHKDDKDSIRRLKEGKALENFGLLILIIFLATFIYGLR